jgi:hypothetical protein
VAYLFEEIEGQGTVLEQVVVTVEQQLEGPINKEAIQEFTEKEAVAQRQVKELEPISIPLRQIYPDLSD